MNKLPVNPGNALLYLYRKMNCFIVLAGELLALQPLQPLHSGAGTVSFIRSSWLGRGDSVQFFCPRLLSIDGVSSLQGSTLFNDRLNSLF